MDPNTNLEETLSLAEKILTESDSTVEDGARLAELVQALDVWISNGGLLPDRWKREKS